MAAELQLCMDANKFETSPLNFQLKETANTIRAPTTVFEEQIKPALRKKLEVSNECCRSRIVGRKTLRN